MVFVMPQHRRRGYGKVVVSQLASVYLKRGLKAMVCIEETNDVSTKLHENLGFKVIPELRIGWLTVNPV